MKLAARARLARLDRPVGVLLTGFPAVWGLSMAAAPHVPPSSLLLTMGVGALFARSAGCVANDLWDRKFDARVARTAQRPLASGELSVREGYSTLAVTTAGAALCEETQGPGIASR
jgi:4-hydroxybenzoate polyprenyltransferase